MKNWLRIAAGAMMTVALSVNAQSVDQRRTLQESIATTELGALADKFQKQFEADEAKVRQYLIANPTAKREEVKNGKTHYMVRIDKDGSPVYRVARDSAGSQKNRASGQLIKVDSLYPGGSLGVSITGTGMIAGVWEPSALPADSAGAATHELLLGQATNQAGQVISATVADQSHAAHVTGTMVGKDLASRPSARGLAFGGKSQNFDSQNDLTEMTTFAANGFLVSNHSYGDANTQTANLWKYGAYDTEAKDWDAMLKAAPNYLPFVAVGNEQGSSGNNAAKAGYDIMTGPANSKNAMGVGAVNADKTMSTYSNWGPTDDGRVKPDIVAKGTGIDSAQATSTTAYSGSGDDSSGTSYASPAAAASGLLLQQYYASVTSGAFMRSSTLKALMLGTAEDLGRPGPDHQFGWGLLNIEKAAQTIKKRSPLVATLATSKGSHIEEIAVNPAANSTAEITRTVFAKGGEPLVVNIGWIDDEGPEQLAGEGIDPTTSRMVYEFDVMVRQVAPNALVETWPWIVPSMANRTANATLATAWFQSNGGNFRQVIIANPIANAEYTIIIRKKTGSPAADRSLSLVVTGLVEAVALPPVNGACGGANATPSLVAPTANLCSAGTASAVASGANSFNWTCDGSNGGTAASCAAPRQYTVTATAGANGTLTCVSPVTGGNTTTCTADPAANFKTQSISGCGGTATGVNVNGYTTGTITADCTVTAAFVTAAINDAQCGSAHAVATPTAPTANLCSPGFPTPVTSGVNSFNWGCNVEGGGANTTCSAPRQYTVTATAGANGTMSCTTPVIGGTTSSCTATPAGGFTTVSISGCNGTATAAGVNTYTTGTVAADCTVNATFTAVIVPVNGTCGSANGVPSLVAPSANLCNAGTASTVASGTNSFTWTCNGSSGGTNASCAAPHQYTVTATAGANGALNCVSPVTGGTTTTCTATPASGFVTQSIIGCSGTATGSGVNSYSTGVIAANCTVNATFAAVAAPVNGACGSANAVPGLAAPSSNLCSAGTATAVVSGSNSFTWSCNGVNGGTNASCAAPRQYTVTATAGANGTLTCANPVTAGTTSACTATPAAGFATQSISGCGGTATAVGVNSYTTASLTADCTVSAAFAVVAVPITYSITGTASPAVGGTVTCTPTTVSSGGSASCTAAANAGFTFSAFTGNCAGASCNLTNVTSNQSVTVLFSPVRTFSGVTATGTGAASASFTGGGTTCRFDATTTAFIAASATNPTGTYPHGWLRAKLIGCTPGATVRMSVVWPSLTGTYSKYGKMPSSSGASVFYQPANLTTTGNTASFDITDGGLGDDDLLADGILNDPSGPLAIALVATPSVPVPTLSELAMVLLGLLMVTAGMLASTKRRRHARRTA